jgi:hypothetical protein
MSTSQYETKSVIRVQRRRAAEFVESSRWQTLIEDQREEFDEEHRLAGNVLVKFHGLAASPIGGLVAACFSLHPSDRLDYLLPHRDSSIIIFDDEYLDLSAWFPTSTDKETVPDGKMSQVLGQGRTNDFNFSRIRVEHRTILSNSAANLEVER